MSKKDYKVPPKKIPKKLLDQFTMGGEVEVEDKYLDNANPEIQAEFNEKFTRQQLCDYQAQCSQGETNYYGSTDLFLWNAFVHFPIAGKHVVLMGSANPWYEAVLLNWGAKKVTVVEYSPRPDIHPLITYVQPDDLGDEQFDACVSISSFEHDGLGRYGDPINPDGDLEAMDTVKRILKDDGHLYLGLPVGKDKVVWNAHRIYGPKRLEKLLQGWATHVIVGMENAQDLAKDTGIDATFQPVFVLKKFFPEEEDE